jgi:hypothetical protein
MAVLAMQSCDRWGHPFGMWEWGALIFTEIVVVVNVKVRFLSLDISSLSIIPTFIYFVAGCPSAYVATTSRGDFRREPHILVHFCVCPVILVITECVLV